jgi:arylsulfatase A-like enzyme
MVAATAVAIVTGAIASACARAPTPDRLVIVTLDTTRADRLPAYGDSKVATPALDRLAHEGVVFDHTESVAPLTLTAHSSLFTGLYPPHHGVRDNADPPLDARYATLAEMLHARGLRTAAFVGSTVLAADRGLARGFDVYEVGGEPGVAPPRRRPASRVVDDALTWLDAAGSSAFFMWVHLYDAHAPQTLPEEFRQRYATDLYAGAIAFMDSQIGRLLDRLEQKGAIETTAVIVVADHGESLGDHGELEHGIFLYESALHVPLIVRAPKVAPRRISALTSLVDIVPTVLELMGAEPRPADGVSLMPALSGHGALPERAVYAESMYPRRFGWSPLRMLCDGRFKLIDAPRPELYDLDVDPFEGHNLAIERPTVVRAMRGGVEAMSKNRDDGASAGGTVLPAADTGALLALGYVSGSPPPPTSLGRDPKDFIEEYNAVSRRRTMR